MCNMNRTQCNEITNLYSHVRTTQQLHNIKDWSIGDFTYFTLEWYHLCSLRQLHQPNVSFYLFNIHKILFKVRSCGLTGRICCWSRCCCWTVCSGALRFSLTFASVSLPTGWKIKILIKENRKQRTVIPKCMIWNMRS